MGLANLGQVTPKVNRKWVLSYPKSHKTPRPIHLIVINNISLFHVRIIHTFALIKIRADKPQNTFYCNFLKAQCQ